MPRNSSKSEGSTTLLFDVWLVTHLTGRLLDDALRPTGLTGDEFGLYSLMYARAPVTPTQISRWTGMAPTTVSGMLRRMGNRKHLTQAPNPDDARSHVLRLSAAGLRVTAEAAATLDAVLGRLHDVLGSRTPAVRAGLQELDTALRELLDMAEPYHVAPADEMDGRPALAYQGERLTRAQVNEVRAYIDWLRVRDRPDPPTPK